MAKKKNQRISEAELKRQHELSLKKWDTIANLGRTGLIGTFVVLCLFVSIALPVYYSSGKTTIIQYALDWFADVNVEFWVVTGAAAGATAWGYAERKMRFRERAEKDARISQYEKMHDPNRSSSQLTPEGKDASQGEDKP